MAASTYPEKMPLVSVIIPSYNRAGYLPKAIESVLRQSYSNTEIVVVDDGSTDETEAIATSYPAVYYVYQKNKGSTGARNTGIQKSTGEFLLFLDSDDWLYPKAIEENVQALLENKDAAFASGTFDAFYMEENAIKETVVPVTRDHYCHLLDGNYIGMLATVLFRRSILEEFQFNPRLVYCEDYDLYLRIARKYPVYHHLQKIAVYRWHSTNISCNIPAMLQGSLDALERQKAFLKTKEERHAFRKGKENWKKYYCQELYQRVKVPKRPMVTGALFTLLKYRPQYALHYFIKADKTMIKRQVKKLIPGSWLRYLHKNNLYKNYLPPVGKIEFGDFALTKPFSREFGYDRGGPIDRFYIEDFLGKEASGVQGRVLEIGDNEYTLRFGEDKVTQSDILHVDDSNPKATFIADISQAPQLPDNTFDCILLTQTLHLIYDFKEALKTCHRILKPGGQLLLTVPGINPIDHGEWEEIWFWSFTDKSMKRVMAETFPGALTEVSTYGNVFAASSFLYGVGLSEVPEEKLTQHDPHYQVIVAVKAVKATP